MCLKRICKICAFIKGFRKGFERVYKMTQDVLVSKRLESKNKLRNAFEDIYARYSQDFPEVNLII